MDDTDQTVTAEKAFQDAAIGYEFKGQPLLAWSGSREIAAQGMGMKAPAFNASDLEAINEGHIYPGGLRDAIICMWICSTKNASELSAEDVKAKAWTVQRARNNPSAAYDVAERWATTQGITGAASEAFAEAYKLMFAILNGVSVSQFEVKIEGDSGGSGSPGKV